MNTKELVPDCLEAACVEVSKTKCAPLLVSTIYRPLSSRIDILEKIENLIQNLDGENKEVVDDVNCDLELLPRTLSRHTKRLLGIANLFQLTQIILLPTRVSESTSTLVVWFLTTSGYLQFRGVAFGS